MPSPSRRSSVIALAALKRARAQPVPRDGLPGQDAVVDYAAIGDFIRQQIAALPLPSDGENGVVDEVALTKQVEALVREEVARRVKALPKAADVPHKNVFQMRTVLQQGPKGTTPNVQAGTTTTGAAGTAAVVTRRVGSPDEAPILDFTIPRGADGSNGVNGTNGTNGTNGVTPNVQAGTTTTGAAGSAAAVVRRAGSPDTAPIFDFTVPRGDTGLTGPAGLGTVTPAVSTRTIGSAGFQTNATKAVAVSYSITCTATTAALAGTSSVVVQLLSDANPTPTTVRAQTGASAVTTLAIALGLTTGQTIPLDYIVPPGHYVRLVSTIVGTATAAIAAQTEETLG